MRNAVVLTICVLLLAPASMVFAGEAMEKGPVYGVEVGEISQPVDLKSIDNKQTINTGTLKNGTVFMLVSSVCTACTSELKEVSRNIEEFKGRDLVAVVIDMDPARAAQSLARWKIPMYSDPEWAFGNAVGLASAPSVVVLGKDGKILYKKYGYQKDQWKEYAEAK